MCAGILGRGYWTPDEPREADLAWRMSWQPEKAVPLLAGEAFCEKPPLTYWIAGGAIGLWGADAWAARLPNLLYAFLTALSVGLIARRSAGPMAGLVAAAAISTFLLSYQVAIWLAADAPLLAAVAMALLGLYVGYYANGSAERLRGYSCMHAALALGFLTKSAAAWMVPTLTLIALMAWEKRWRELLRWELYVGIVIQAALILAWVWAVYVQPEGPAHLKVFFWNNLVGRFAAIDAPQELQYAAAHRNFPGKYLVELPVYLWPWTLLVLAATRHAWRQRRASLEQMRAVRFAAATFLPAFALLSVAATARNIYLAPALPGIALLLGWWVRDLAAHDRWDVRALRATSLGLLLAVMVCAVAVTLIGLDAWDVMGSHTVFVAVSIIGLVGAAAFAAAAWRHAGRGRLLRGLFALAAAYCALLIGPASQIYRRVDTWQDLAAIGRAIERDAYGRPLILLAADETTRAFIDMYARTSVALVPAPVSAGSKDTLRALLASNPRSLVVWQLPGRSDSRMLRELRHRWGMPLSAGPGPFEGTGKFVAGTGQFVAGTGQIEDPGQRAASPVPGDQVPGWAADSGLRMVQRYALPNGRRYALLDSQGADSTLR